jgi:hypothetical protein
MYFEQLQKPQRYKKLKKIKISILLLNLLFGIYIYIYILTIASFYPTLRD